MENAELMQFFEDACNLMTDYGVQSRPLIAYWYVFDMHRYYVSCGTVSLISVIVMQSSQILGRQPSLLENRYQAYNFCNGIPFSTSFVCR